MRLGDHYADCRRRPCWRLATSQMPENITAEDFASGFFAVPRKAVAADSIPAGRPGAPGLSFGDPAQFGRGFCRCLGGRALGLRKA